MFGVFWVCLDAECICRANRTLDGLAVLLGIDTSVGIRTQKYLIFLAAINHI